jgi:aspartate/methionine/tyrosine aminotransferase
MNFARRLDKLGTETAFAVSLDAAEFAANGNAVYPFHLGDIDLPTPKNIMDAALKAMKEGKTGYNPAAGLPEMRSVVADVVGRERGIELIADNVVIQPGGKPVIPGFINACMNFGITGFPPG